MTRLEFVNKFFFQWFFIRLARCRKTEGEKVYQWYSIMGCILPLTGWKSNYIRPFKFMLRISRVKFNHLNHVFKFPYPNGAIVKCEFCDVTAVKETGNVTLSKVLPIGDRVTFIYPENK